MGDSDLAATPSSLWRPIPGPQDRESFAAEQARQRRAGRRLGALSAVAVAVMGVPLSAALSPLLLSAVLLGNDLVNLRTPTPDPFAPIKTTANSPPPSTPAWVVAAIVLLVLPGALVLLGSWLGVRRLLHRWGPGAELLAMGVRDPRPEDHEERRLVNVVAEMAIAAGVTAPGVKIIDSPVANAAAVGSCLDEATIVVSRGLLDDLSREETKGVIAHLIASVGNGDLQVARTMASVFQTLGLISIVLNALGNRGARRDVIGLLATVLRPSRRRDPQAAAAAADLLLEAEAGRDQAESTSGGCLSLLTLPLLGGALAFTTTEVILGSLFVAPLMKRAWRARSYRADASAVEITRNPTGVAKGLAALTQRGGLIPGTEALGYLFVVGADASRRPAATTRRALPVPPTPAAEDRDGRARSSATSVESQRVASNSPSAKPAQLRASQMVNWQAPLARRMDRLARIGATVTLPPTARPRSRAATITLVVVGGPFVVVFYGLMIAICAACFVVGMAMYGLFLVPVVGLLHGFLRHLG